MKSSDKINSTGKMSKFSDTYSAGLLGANYWGDGSDGDLTISVNTTWDSGSGGDMLVKNFNNLTINSGITLTIKGRKGCLVYVKGNFANNGGTIDVQSGYACDPSAAGVSSNGLRIIRAKSGCTETLASSDLTGCGSTAIAVEANQSGISGNGKIYTISRTGASGAGATGSLGGTWTVGSNGNNGGTLQAGGGGGGGGVTYGGGNATCFSGGAGGGGTGGYTNVYIAPPDNKGSSIGGVGGPGTTCTGYSYYGSGGAGNPGGTPGTSGAQGESRIGGLLCVFVRGDLTNSGLIKADGGLGGAVSGGYCGHGGSSGGGIVLGLYGGSLSNTGTIRANGGAIAPGTGWPGGAGGVGSVLVEQIAL